MLFFDYMSSNLLGLPAENSSLRVTERYSGEPVYKLAAFQIRAHPPNPRLKYPSLLSSVFMHFVVKKEMSLLTKNLSNLVSPGLESFCLRSFCLKSFCLKSFYLNNLKRYSISYSPAKRKDLKDKHQ